MLNVTGDYMCPKRTAGIAQLEEYPIKSPLLRYNNMDDEETTPMNHPRNPPREPSSVNTQTYRKSHSKRSTLDLSFNDADNLSAISSKKKRSRARRGK